MIGLIKKEYGWERILEQEKTLWEIADFKKELDKYSLLIVNSQSLSSDEINKIKNYIVEGGAVLTDTLSFEKIKKVRILKQHISYIDGKGKLFKNINRINIDRIGYLIKNANKGLINNKYPAIYFSQYGKGFVVVLPFDLNLLMLDERSKKLYLPSSYAPLKENLSLVSKGDLRRLIVNCFHYLHSIRNIPYTHIWYYPKNYDSVFCYRIDLDVFNREEIQKIITVIKNNNNIKLTWFVSVINSRNHKEGIEQLYSLNQDIQSHAYRHLIYSSYEDNYNDINISNKFISKVAKHSVGFAAPFGHWNKNLGLALEKSNYLYSSEFSLSYDDLPFYPMLTNNKSKTIQFPIYPSCIGLLRMRLYSKNKMKSYFDYLIDMQYKKQMPLFLYDHPNDGIGKYPEILDFIIKKVKNYNILITDFLKFYYWWKKREKVKYKVLLLNNKLKIITKNKNKDMFIRIILPNNKEIRLSLKNQIVSLKELKTNEIPIFNDKKITYFDIMSSKLLFSLYYSKVLAGAIKRRILGKIL